MRAAPCALRLPPGEHEAVLTFQDADGVTVARRTQNFLISVPPPVDGRTEDLVVFRSDLPN